MHFLRLSLATILIIPSAQIVTDAQIIDHFDCRSMAVQLAKHYAGEKAKARAQNQGDPDFLDQLLYLTSPGRGTLKGLSKAQIAFLDQLKLDLEASGSNLASFLASSHAEALRALESDIANKEELLARYRISAQSTQAEIERIASGVGTGFSEGGWAASPGTRWNQAAQAGPKMRLAEWNRRIGLLEAELATARAQYADLKSVTPEKAMNAFLKGNGLLELYSSVEAQRAQARAIEQARQVKEAELAAEKARMEQAEADRVAQENQATNDRATLSWNGEIMGVQKHLNKKLERLDEAQREEIVKLQGAIAVGDAKLIESYLDRSWDGIYSLYQTANSKLGRHAEATAAVTLYLMPLSEKSKFDPSQTSFLESIKATSLYKSVEALTSPVGHAFRQSISELSPKDQQFARGLSSVNDRDFWTSLVIDQGLRAQKNTETPTSARNVVRAGYFAVRSQVNSHEEAVAGLIEQLAIPASAQPQFKTYVDAVTINMPSARALRAARSTSVGAAAFLASVGALSYGSQALHDYAGVTQAPTMIQQLDMAEPALKPVLDKAMPVYDAVGDGASSALDWLSGLKWDAAKFGETMGRSRRAEP